MRFVSLIRSVWDVLFPPLCPLCGRLLRGDALICDVCMATLPRTEHHLLRGNLTEEQLRASTHVEKAASFLYYQPTPQPHPSPSSHPSLAQSSVASSHVQSSAASSLAQSSAASSLAQSSATAARNAGKLLRLIKYYSRPELATYLAEAAAREWQQSGFWEGIDLIIPVPLHPRRLRARGYNQSLYIARGLSKVTGIPVDTAHLIRIRNNRHQARLNEQQRAANVRDIFRLVHPEDLKGKHILLVDDIITTGNTLRASLKPFLPLCSSRSTRASHPSRSSYPSDSTQSTQSSHPSRSSHPSGSTQSTQSTHLTVFALAVTRRDNY